MLLLVVSLFWHTFKFNLVRFNNCNCSGQQVPAAWTHGRMAAQSCMCCAALLLHAVHVLRCLAAAGRDYRRHNKYAARKVDRSPLDFSQVRPLAGACVYGQGAWVHVTCSTQPQQKEGAQAYGWRVQ